MCVLLGSAAAAFGVWKFTPGTGLDRAAFVMVASGFANPPLFISGSGTHAAPWSLRTFSVDAKPDKRQAPVIVSLGDDVEGFFQSSPPAPIDLAVVFRNFQRLGAKKAATAAVMAWEEPDPIGLAALEQALDGFESLVMAAPLSRGAVSSPLPAAFRRASLALSAVHGDTSSLPVVNRVPIPGAILGGETSMAGFSILETEPSTRFSPLMARWEDRVVLAFPVLAVLQRLNLPPGGMEVRLGEFLKLGPDGPVVPIDDYGRLAVPLRPLSAYAEFAAEALIDGGDELFPKQAPDPVILRDDRTATEPATRAFSRNLSATVAALASDGGIAPVRAFPRLGWEWEIGLLSALVVALALACRASGFAWHLGACVLAGICCAAQWTGVGAASIWLPGLPALAGIFAAVAVSPFAGRPGLAAPVAMAVEIPEVEISDEKTPAPPEPVVEVGVTKMSPAAKGAKKAATKKTAAKKAPSVRKRPPPEF